MIPMTRMQSRLERKVTELLRVNGYSQDGQASKEKHESLRVITTPCGCKPGYWRKQR